MQGKNFSVKNWVITKLIKHLPAAFSNKLITWYFNSKKANSK